MKKIAYLILPLFVFVLLSCEDKDADIYSGESIAYFTETSSTFTVQSGSVYDVEVIVSSATTEDRTFTLEVDASSDAPSASYSFSTSGIIPANSHSGTVQITGNVLDVVSGTKLVLNLVSVDESNVSFDGTLTLTMQQFCPLDLADFALMDADENAGSDSYQVTISAGTEPNEIIITNLFNAGPAATTTAYMIEDGYVVTFPEDYNDNFLYTNPTYNAPCWVSGEGYESTWSSCQTTMDLNFEVLINIGGDLYTFGDTNVVLTQP
jgi:hypothetical protein